MRLSMAGLLLAALLACLPAPALAAQDGTRQDLGGPLASALAAAGSVGPGAGYDNARESRIVRRLQLRLRALGHRPGPIDGLFGPLTEAAVMRFQRSRGLATDGVVGPLTKKKLIGRRPDRAAPRVEQPARQGPADTSPRAHEPAHPQPARPRTRVDHPPGWILQARRPAPTAGDVPAHAKEVAPGLAAALGAACVLALAALWAAVRRPSRRPQSGRGDVVMMVGGVNVGLACAALLATFALGAVSGAVFATSSSPKAPAERAEAPHEAGLR